MRDANDVNEMKLEKEGIKCLNMNKTVVRHRTLPYGNVIERFHCR